MGKNLKDILFWILVAGLVIIYLLCMVEIAKGVNGILEYLRFYVGLG